MKKALLLLWFSIISVFCDGNAHADEATSVWVLIAGKSGRTSYWTVTKLRSFQKDEIGSYEGAATTSKVLLGLFGDVPILYDPGVLTIDSKSAIKITEAQNIQSVVETLVQGLFVEKNARFTLEFPIEAGQSSNWPVFIYKPVIVKLVSASADLSFQRKLVERFSKNRKWIIGETEKNDIVNGSESHVLAKFWKSILLEGVPGISVSYSALLDTFFFSMPSSSDKSFYETCESILSGNR